MNESGNRYSSRLPGFYRRSLPERLDLLADQAGLTTEDQAALAGPGGLSLEQANQMIENVVGLYALPLGIAANFTINGRDYLVPMVIEEPSVVAAVSFAARLVRQNGGFRAETTAPVMVGQVQLLDIQNLEAATQAILAERPAILAQANEVNSTLVARGGGALGLEVRPLLDTQAGPMLIVHLLYDVRDAMGANALNTAVEAIAPLLAQLTGGRVNLRILSNLSDRRLARAWATVRATDLAGEDPVATPGSPGLARRIVEANAFAVADPYRAATHNKGILNGIDAVALATGNDWRAVEAGAHAYAAPSGQYRALTDWRLDAEGNLAGFLELPLAAGTVGGATRVHPVARVALKLLRVKSADELAAVMAAVGLAQNLAAVRALAAEGIQQGHMRLHARQVALAAGAQPDQVEAIAAHLVAEGQIRQERAVQLLNELDEERKKVDDERR